MNNSTAGKIPIDSMIRIAEAFVPVEVAARAAVRVIDMSLPEYADLKDSLAHLDRVMSSVLTRQKR